MEALSYPSNAASPDENTLGPIQELYDRGLYQRAYNLIPAIAPVKTWRGSQARILAGRLCRVLGAYRLGTLIQYIARREKKAILVQNACGFFYTFCCKNLSVRNKKIAG